MTANSGLPFQEMTERELALWEIIENQSDHIQSLRDQLEREHDRLMDAQRELAGKCEEDFS